MNCGTGMNAADWVEIILITGVLVAVAAGIATIFIRILDL
jgi:hypothetical protein